jgi:hypothetical protein
VLALTRSALTSSQLDWITARKGSARYPSNMMRDILRPLMKKEFIVPDRAPSRGGRYPGDTRYTITEAGRLDLVARIAKRP